MRKWNSTGLHLHLQILLVLALSYCKILCLYSLYSLITQSCLTLCNPMDYRLSGSSFHGILQARILEWVAISFSRGSSQPRDRTPVSRIAGRRFTMWATREDWHSWLLQAWHMFPCPQTLPFHPNSHCFGSGWHQILLAFCKNILFNLPSSGLVPLCSTICTQPE